MFLDSKIAAKKQEFFNVLETGTPGDISHFLLGTGSDMMRDMIMKDENNKVFDYRLSYMQGLLNECKSKVSENNNIDNENKIKVNKILDRYFESVFEKQISIRRNKDAKTTVALNFMLVAILPVIGVEGLRIDAEGRNEIGVWRTAPDLFLKNRPELVEKFAGQCQMIHVNDQKNLQSERVKDFWKEREEELGQDAALEIQFSALPAEDLQACIKQKIEEKIVGHEDGADFRAKFLSAIGLLAVGGTVAIRRRVKKYGAAVEREERKLLSSRKSTASALSGISSGLS